MRRILFCALLAIMTCGPLLNAQDQDSAPQSLADLNRRGQLPQLIQAANSVLANAKSTPADQGLALFYIGHAYQELGDFTKAIANYEKALAVVNSDGQHTTVYAGTLAGLATTYAEMGQIDTAKHVLLRSIHLLENASDHAAAATIWTDLASIAAEQHDRGEAHKYMKHSIAESQLADNMSLGEQAALSTTAGEIAELDKDFNAAISDYQHALDLWQQAGKDQQQKTAWLYVLMGGAYLQAGDIAHARETTSRGLALLEAASGRQTLRYYAAQLQYSKVLDASGAHGEASTLRKQAQASLNTGTDRQRAQSTISVSALR